MGDFERKFPSSIYLYQKKFMQKINGEKKVTHIQRAGKKACCKIMPHTSREKNFAVRESIQKIRACSKSPTQRGRVVRAPDLKSEGRVFKSRSDHLAGVCFPVQLLGHACK